MRRVCDAFATRLRRLPSCRYEFRAAALNLKGPSAWSAASAAARTLLTVPDPPEPPALHATAAQHGAASESIAGRSAVTLLLRAPASDGGLPISRYEVSHTARYPARHGIPIGTASPSARYPHRHGAPHGRSSRKNPSLARGRRPRPRCPQRPAQ
jgi:hypothetical protein